MQKFEDKRSCILSLLKQRNAKEQSFKEIILYSSKLLESLDYLQKESIQQQLYTAKVGGDSNENPEETKFKAKIFSLQQELAECHCKISSLAEQVIRLKDELDEKNFIFSKQSKELKQIQTELQTSQEFNSKYKSQIDTLKKTLQDRIDEYNTLDITFASVERRLTKTCRENQALKAELASLKEVKEKCHSLGYIEKDLVSDRMKSSGDSVAKLSKKDSVPDLVSQPPKSVSPSTDDSVPCRKLHEFAAHDSAVNAIMWLPDSSINLLTAGSDRRVKFWEVSDDDVELKTYVRDCNSAIMSLDTDMDIRFILCASCDFASRVWTISDFTLRHTLTGHSGKVMSAKFLKDQCKIVSGSTDQTLKLWDFGRRVCTVTYPTSSSVNDVLSKDSNIIISSHCDNRIRFWDTRIDTETGTLCASSKVTSLDLSDTGIYLLASEENQLKLFDIRINKELTAMSAKNFSLGCNWTRAKLSPNSKFSGCGSKNGSIFVWNSFTGTLEKELRTDLGNAICCSWSSCGSYLTGCGNGKCVIWSK